MKNNQFCSLGLVFVFSLALGCDTGTGPDSSNTNTNNDGTDPADWLGQVDFQSETTELGQMGIVEYTDYTYFAPFAAATMDVFILASDVTAHQDLTFSGEGTLIQLRTHPERGTIFPSGEYSIDPFDYTADDPGDGPIAPVIGWGSIQRGDFDDDDAPEVHAATGGTITVETVGETEYNVTGELEFEDGDTAAFNYSGEFLYYNYCDFLPAFCVSE